MRKIAVIPARGGSKGLPDKNMLLADGKPLLAYSVEAALDSGEFERIIVSTDSQEYIDALQHFDYPVEYWLRDAALAGDGASSFVVLQNVLQQLDTPCDYFVLLQPTSPLRDAAHIRAACRALEARWQDFDFLVSVCAADVPTSLIRPLAEDGSLRYFDLDYANYARQNNAPEVCPNGAVFAAKPAAYLQQRHFFGARALAFPMDKTASLDIDDAEDFDYFYFVLQQRNAAAARLANVRLRIAAKSAQFAAPAAPVSFIGHSVLDEWDVAELGGRAVRNLAVSGITAAQYADEILAAGKIRALGGHALLMFGSNDIVQPGWTCAQITADICRVIEGLRVLRADVRIALCAVPPTAFRKERRNSDIVALNDYLRAALAEQVQWIDCHTPLLNRYGKLDLAYSRDGLHLNDAGNKVLRETIEKAWFA